MVQADLRPRAEPRDQPRRGRRHRRRDPGRHPQGRRQGPGAARRHAAVARHRDPRRDVHQDHRAQRDDPDAQVEDLHHRRRQPDQGRDPRAAGRARDRRAQQVAGPVRAGRHPAGAPRGDADRGHVRHRLQRHRQRPGPGPGHPARAEDPRHARRAASARSEINAIIEDAKKHAEEDRRRAEFIRAQARLEGLVDSNQKTFNEFGSMLARRAAGRGAQDPRRRQAGPRERQRLRMHRGTGEDRRDG